MSKDEINNHTPEYPVDRDPKVVQRPTDVADMPYPPTNVDGKNSVLSQQPTVINDPVTNAGKTIARLNAEPQPPRRKDSDIIPEVIICDPARLKEELLGFAHIRNQKSHADIQSSASFYNVKTGNVHYVVWYKEII